MRRAARTIDDSGDHIRTIVWKSLAGIIWVMLVFSIVVDSAISARVIGNPALGF